MFNLFSPREVELKERKDLSSSISAFIFEKPRGFNFEAGQFLEWTLKHPEADDRGETRYFTVSASPSEDFLMITTRFSEKSSSFKAVLRKMEKGEKIRISGARGEFTLPSKPKPLVFIAGGIGITPFRSMIKFMLDEKISTPITLFYSNKTAEDIVFKEIFGEAEKSFLKTVYIVTDDVSGNWKGEKERINPEMIKREVPDWLERNYYISGPEPMVKAFEKMTEEMGVPGKNIKHDYFPGYAD